MRPRPAVIALLLILGACATRGDPGREGPAARGETVARRACAACHAVRAGGGESPAPRAPGFASLELRHTVGLEGRLADLTRQGHYGMPPIALSAGELADLKVYIESLHSH